MTWKASAGVPSGKNGLALTLELRARSNSSTELSLKTVRLNTSPCALTHCRRIFFRFLRFGEAGEAGEAGAAGEASPAFIIESTERDTQSRKKQ